MAVDLEKYASEKPPKGGGSLDKLMAPKKSGAGRDILDAIKADDPEALELALKLYMGECEEEKEGAQDDTDDEE